MKKTVLISEIFPPIHGGSGRWFWELYSRLPKDQYLIAAGDNDEASEFDKTHTLNLQRFNLSSWSWGLKSVTGLKYYWRTYWQLRKYIKQNKIGIIHCGRCLPEGFMGFLLSKSLNLPLVCYVHGEDVEAAATSRELSWVVNKVLNHAKKIISNSQNTASLLTDNWQVDKNKIAILNPGVDAKRFVPAEKNIDIRSQLGWNEGPVILTVGRLQKRKGQDMLIKALPAIKQAIPDVLYAIIGGGEELVNLQNLVDELDLQNNVMFMSEIDDETMIQCYQQCDLFVLPNRTVDQDIEGFGMVLVEAQACGTVVIAGDSGGTKETMLINESGFVVDCTRPEPLADQCIAVLSNPEKAKTMGLKGREHVEVNLDWLAHKEQAVILFNSFQNK